MFDLNEVPDQPIVDAGLEADEKAASSSTPNAIVSNGILEETSISCQSQALPSGDAKGDGFDLPKEGMASVNENSSSKRPANSSLSLEMPSTKRQNVSISMTAVTWQQQDRENPEAVVSPAKGVEESGSALVQEQLLLEQRFSDGINVFSTADKVAFHFLGESSVDASTSHKHISLNQQDGGLAGTILSLKNNSEPVAASAGSVLGLSLGGIFHKSVPCDGALNLTHSTSKGTDLYAFGLGKSQQAPSLTSRKSSDLSPFWHGKLCVNNTSVFTPIVAYCLGIMAPDSRLKKLPSTLNTRRFLKLEELEKTVHKGVAEPLMQLKPSTEASVEEVRLFNLMVKTLSLGAELLQSPTFSDSAAGRLGLPADGKPASSAALISWDGDSLDAKLCLVSISSIRALLNFCKGSMILDFLEGIDGLDPESLYGFICYSTASASNKKLELQDTVKTLSSVASKRPERVTEASVASAERGRETLRTDRTTSPSDKKHHSTRTEILSKSVSMQPIRVSSRDATHKLDSEEVGKGSRRRYERQSSADKIREASGKYHSRYGSGTRVLDDADIGHTTHEQGQSKHREKSNWNSARQTPRQDWRSDRLKDSIRRSKEDRDSSKQRVKEHERHAYRDEERDKLWKSHGTAEQNRDQEKLHSKEREKLSKDTPLKDSKMRSSSEKNNSGSKNKTSLSHRTSPDQDSGRLSRKRDREDEKERVISVKRSRESEVHDSKQLTVSLSNDLKLKLDGHASERDTTLMIGLDSVKPGKELHTLDTQACNNGKFDTIVGAVDIDAQVLNTKLAIPLLGRGTVDEGSKETESCGIPISLLGPSELTASPHPLRLLVERNGLPDEGAPSEIMVDTLSEKVNEEKHSNVEFILDVPDKETRTWLLSKQNSLYLEEEYGVRTTISAEFSNCDTDSKTDLQTGPVTVRFSVIPSEPSDAVEDKWFLEQASATVKSIASRGVFIKCLWYEGPVQIHSGDGAPSVPIIVKKIKGEDGKNLEKIQDLTGVMIGVVLRKCGTGASQEMELLSRPRFIGLRLKCVRRKGLLEALKEAEALLESVADHFSKELATHIATHILDLQPPALHPNETMSNEGSPSIRAIATKELLPNLPVKDEGSPSSSKLKEAALSASVLALDSKISFSKEEPDASLSTEQEVASRSLYVSNLPEHISPIKIHNLFENVLREKLEPWADLDHVSELVVDVRYIPEKTCALVLLVNDALVNASLKLYAEEKTVFQGMAVELGPSERQGSVTRIGIRREVGNGEHVRGATLAKKEEESIAKKQGAANNDYDSDCSQEHWYAQNSSSRIDPFPGRPRPLFLSELMRNASAPAIKQLFEDIISTYIGPNLVSAGGRQLVLDVRYVPSRGCAFVDLATPELVEFMLDLHARRPEVFMNMKMELGRKPVPYSVEEDSGGRLNLRLHGKSHFSSQTFGYRLSLASRKKVEKRSNGSFDLEDSDKGDDLLWLTSRIKKQRSDPEKTIYADRLPENASEGTIKRIFERVLAQKLTREEMEALGDQLITEVRHVPSKYCAFVVFVTEDLTRTVLQLYNQDEEIFESMRLKPHFHSRMEDLYKDELQEIDDIVHTPSLRERLGSLDNDNARLRQLDLHDSSRSRSAAHRAITASAFREVDRRRSVYVDKIPEDLSEATMTEMFEKVFRHKKHGHDGHMVSQVAYFRDKFDPSKLCAFVELKTEDGTQDLVDYYNANLDAFRGMRVRPGFKYHS